MKKWVNILALASLTLAATGTAQAALVTSMNSAYTQLVQNFDGLFATGSSVAVGVGGLNVNARAAGGTMYFGPPLGAWALGGNGDWTSAKTFVGVDGDFQSPDIAASLYFDIGSARVREVGAQINFDPDFTYGLGSPLPLYIAAYDFGGNLIEDFFVSISTPGAINGGVFYGISVGVDIARFEVSGPFAVVDNLSFGVPEPSTALLLPLALAGMLVRRRRS